MNQIIASTIFEAVIVILLIVGFVNEEKFIEFEQSQIRYIKALKRACKIQNIGFWEFIKIVFLTAITPVNKLDELREKIYKNKADKAKKLKVKKGGQNNV